MSYKLQKAGQYTMNKFSIKIKNIKSLYYLLFSNIGYVCCYIYQSFYNTYPKGHFQVFSTPDVHSPVIGAYFIEIVSIYREEASGHGRRSVYNHNHSILSPVLYHNRVENLCKLTEVDSFTKAWK